MVLKTFDQETVNLVPDSLLMKSILELSQYRIIKWQLVYYDDGAYHITKELVFVNYANKQETKMMD